MGDEIATVTAPAGADAPQLEQLAIVQRVGELVGEVVGTLDPQVAPPEWLEALWSQSQPFLSEVRGYAQNGEPASLANALAQRTPGLATLVQLSVLARPQDPDRHATAAASFRQRAGEHAASNARKHAIRTRFR
jgi:hypothetical protein